MNSSDINTRQPIIPLSLEDIDKSRPKEFIFDYVNNVAYIRLTNGSLFNITKSESSLKHVKKYIEENQDIILNAAIILKLENGDQVTTVNRSIDYIYECIQDFNDKENEFKYAAGDENGNAIEAIKSNRGIEFVLADSSKTYNGEEDTYINLQNLFSKSGGNINGDMIPKKKFLLSNSISYGFTLPETGTEGQLFILLKEN